MLFHSVKLKNFKSIGEDSLSEIIIEPRITPIIGKNESGKSNVLFGLSYISFIRTMDSAFNKENINRNAVNGNAAIEYSVVLKATSDELEVDELKADTTIEITANDYKATGGIVDYYRKYIQPAISELCEVLDGTPLQLREQEYQNFRNYISALRKNDELNIRQMTEALNFIEVRKNKVIQEKKSSLEQAVFTTKEQWVNILRLLPTIFYRRADKTLKSQYKYEDIKKELESPAVFPNSLLSEFVRLIQVSKEDFLIASQAGVSGQKTSIRKRIQRNIDSYINQPFSDFYDAEEVFLSVDFDSNILYFSVQSNDGESLLLSERSNGLRWYLNTFIDAKANDVTDKNVLYLLDEPGASLHVNAQRELLKLFNHLADKGNQIVYTTHSPYMLDTSENGIHRIRAVVKSQDGNTSIYKTAYDSRIAPDSQKDTLAPIINALGMNLFDTIGPAKDKLNIVTEGMSDYIYLCTMAKELCINTNKYVIIPAVGATNCTNICSILHGWGCQYIALFDYDKAGVESGGEYLRKKLFFNYKRQYCYVADVSEEEIENQSYKTNKYMIEDVMTRSEINRFCEENAYHNSDKTLTAKLMCNAIETGKFVLSEESKKNFQELFERIFSYYS